MGTAAFLKLTKINIILKLFKLFLSRNNVLQSEILEKIIDIHDMHTTAAHLQYTEHFRHSVNGILHAFGILWALKCQKCYTHRENIESDFLSTFWPFTVPMSDMLLIYNKLMKLSKCSFHINAPLLLAVMNLQVLTLWSLKFI